MEKFLSVIGGILILCMISGQIWAWLIFIVGVIILSLVANGPDKTK